jgi:hypothetical protein
MLLVAHLCRAHHCDRGRCFRRAARVPVPRAPQTLEILDSHFVSMRLWIGKHVRISHTVVLYLSVSTCVDSFQDIVEERIGILECYKYLWLAKQPPLRAERL